MRTTLTLDDRVFESARIATGILDRGALIHEGLNLLIRRAAAQRLIALGGSDPNAKLPPRRRPPTTTRAVAAPASKPRVAKVRSAKGRATQAA